MWFGYGYRYGLGAGLMGAAIESSIIDSQIASAQIAAANAQVIANNNAQQQAIANQNNTFNTLFAQLQPLEGAAARGDINTVNAGVPMFRGAYSVQRAYLNPSQAQLLDSRLAGLENWMNMWNRSLAQNQQLTSYPPSGPMAPRPPQTL